MTKGRTTDEQNKNDPTREETLQTQNIYIPAPDRKRRCESCSTRRSVPAQDSKDRVVALFAPGVLGGAGVPRIVEAPIVAADRNSDSHTITRRLFAERKNMYFYSI
jgi:hypothetical protein